MSEETGFAIVGETPRIDCSSFAPTIEIEKMKPAEVKDGLRHILEYYDEKGRARYAGHIPYMASANPIGFLNREHGLLGAKRTGYRFTKA
jgi:hypothetical protein